MILKIYLNTMKSHIGQVGSVKKEKPVPSTSSAPAAVSHSDSKDLLEGPTPNQPPSPGGSKTPKQEAEIEPCSTEENQYVHTETLTPKPEVCILYCYRSRQLICSCATMTVTVCLSDDIPVFITVGAICWFE